MKAIILLVFILPLSAVAQEDSVVLRSIFDEVLVNGECHENLRSLCKDVGHRISGSEHAEKAVDWGENLLNSYRFDSVYKQEIMVPKWVRGPIEKVAIKSKYVPFYFAECSALGGSIGANKGLQGKVIEVQNFEELKKLGRDRVEGNIVFYNRPMNPKLISTFHAYGGCVNQRSSGAIEAAQLGAIGVLVRSMTPAFDKNPHTGVTKYKEGVTKIPAVAISTVDSKNLHDILERDANTQVSIQLSCKNYDDVTSHNVIAEIKGSEYPDEIIVVGWHLDSWDIGEGAHDDGAGVVQSIEVLRLFKALGVKPKRTIRCILYMNEENGNRGGKSYAELVKNKGEKHLLAVETDRGGFSPRGFSIDGTEQQLEKIKEYSSLFEPYGLHFIKKGYSGVDIGPLKNGETCLVGLVPDSQRYFDYHHSKADVFENVNKRELELGAASLASLIYLIDKYGFE